MTFLNYTHYEDDNQNNIMMINESDTLNDLSDKLTDNCLANVADVCIKQEHQKARTWTVIDSMCAIFSLLKKSIELNKPVYLVKQSFSCEDVNGYYFFIGTFEEIEDKLNGLIKGDGSIFDNQNLKTNRW